MAVRLPVLLSSTPVSSRSARLPATAKILSSPSSCQPSSPPTGGLLLELYGQYDSRLRKLRIKSQKATFIKNKLSGLFESDFWLKSVAEYIYIVWFGPVQFDKKEFGYMVAIFHSFTIVGHCIKIVHMRDQFIIYFMT